MKNWVLTVAAVAFSSSALAIPVSVDFFGIDLRVVGEFINAVPVPAADVQFAHLFEAGETVSGSIAYDTAQPDTDPDPNVGTYRIGTLSAAIPELGLLASRFSNSMQISAFNDTANPDDQFFAFVNGVDVFVNGVGAPSPESWSVLLFGDLTMLANDALPTGPLDWTFGNLSFDIRADDGSLRQVLMTFSPREVTEPSMLVLLGLCLLGSVRPRRERRGTPPSR